MSINKEAYARCKSCDTRFYPERNWNTDKFEELCNECRRVSMWAAKVDPVLFMADEDKWIIDTPDPLDHDKEYIQQFATEHQGVSDSLLADDDYHKLGEGAMGNLGYFDK